MSSKFIILVLILITCLPIAFAIQVNSSTEIYTFEVLNCISNTSTIGCPAESVRFSCNITPYVYIDWVQFRINGTDYTTIQNNEIFHYDWNKSITTYDTDTYIGFDRGKIHDIGNGNAYFYPNISVHLNCDSCDWNITRDPCQINDSQDVHYIGDGSPNCTSYNTTESCDYCLPDWQIISNCESNNTEFRQYQDNNVCYNLTGLYSDSCSYSFIDCDTWKPCNYLSTDIDCDYDVNPLIDILGNKIYWKCAIANTSQEYKCLSYVKQQGSIIQTRPQQTLYSIGVVSLPQETREFFTPENGLVSPYFSTENLNSNLTYVFGVECSGPNGTLRTEHYVTPMYRSMEGLAFRSVWVKDNMGYIIGAVIFIIIIVALLMVVRVR